MHIPCTTAEIVRMIVSGNRDGPAAPRFGDVVEMADVRLCHAGAIVPRGYQRADARPALQVDRDYVRKARAAGDESRFERGVTPRLIAAARNPGMRNTNDQLWERLGACATDEAAAKLRSEQPGLMRLAAEARQLLQKLL